MSISPKDRQAIDKAVEDLYSVCTDKDGNRYIKIFADYSDTNEGLLQAVYDMQDIAYQEPLDYEPDKAMIYALQDEISGWYDITIMEMEDDILRTAGFDPRDDMAESQREYLRENYYFQPPFDHYLDQMMKVNIMLDAGNESNRDFVDIWEQYEALIGKLDPWDADEALRVETSLSWLVKQQGYTMDDLQETMQEYIDFNYGESVDQSIPFDERMDAFNKTHSVFLSSVCQELGNMVNYMNLTTILADVSMKEFSELMKSGKEIVFPKGTMLGFFSPWQGGGSMLEIELEKELVVPSGMIWHVQVEGAKMLSQYSVDSVYGLVGNCWKKPLAIRDMPVQEKGKGCLENMIQSAEAQKSSSDAGKDAEARSNAGKADKDRSVT